jgi:hypothetical protein
LSFDGEKHRTLTVAGSIQPRREIGRNSPTGKIGCIEAQAALTVRTMTIGRSSKKAADNLSASGVLQAWRGSTITVFDPKRPSNKNDVKRLAASKANPREVARTRRRETC